MNDYQLQAEQEIWEQIAKNDSPPERFKVEVSTGDPQRYDTNGLLFATVEAAEVYAADLFSRWTLVTDWRVRPATAEEVASGRLATVAGFVS